MRHKSSGYTLVEILVSLFIFSILILMVSQALNSASTNHAILSKHAKRLLDIQTAFSIMNSDFEQILNKKKYGFKASLQPIFEGKANDLKFEHMGYLNPNNEAPRSTLQTTGYQLSDNILSRETYLKQKNENQSDIILSRPLLSEVENIHYKFLGSDKKWYAVWPPTQHWAKILPIAIQVDIRLKDLGLVSRLFMLPGEVYVFAPPPNK